MFAFLAAGNIAVASLAKCCSISGYLALNESAHRVARHSLFRAEQFLEIVEIQISERRPS
jgi:hypothetical protein